MKHKFFDFETYPNWWAVVVSDEEDHYLSSAYNYQFTKEEEEKIKSKMRVYTSDDGIEGIRAYLKDTSKGILTGYNSKRFDLIIQKCVSMQFTPRQIFIAAQIVMGKNDFSGLDTNPTEIARISNYVTGWSARWQGMEAHQDLMDDSAKGLKDKEAAFGMDIQETTVPFGKTDLTEQDKQDIIYYCKHDVFALHVMYVTLSKPYINTKLSVGKTYGIEPTVCYASTNAILVGKALGAERAHGTTIKDPTFTIYEKPIRDYIEKWVPIEALRHLYTSQKPKQMTMFENRVYMADGGIHSVFTTPREGRVASNLYVEATEDWGLYNIDLSGCHPSIMVYVGAMSRGVTKPDVFKDSVLRRRKLKVTPKELWTQEDIEFVPAGKLIHNTAYGAMGNKYLPLYDDYMRSKVCRVSQMIIIAVSMRIYKTIDKVKIIQTNTDGILLHMKREYLDILKAIIKEFEDLSNFVFELEEDSKIWQLNVNNYIAISDKGVPKLKGKSFVQDIWQKGYNQVRPLGNHVVAKAQYEFYVNGKNPVKYLLEHNNVNDFILTCTKGPTYSHMVQETRDGDVRLGSVARVIATVTPKYGQVRKVKYNANGTVSRDLCANCPDHTWITNDALYNYHIEGPINNRELVHVSGMRAQIDMKYYVNQLDKVLDIPWYKLKDGKLTFTKEFNLGGDD